MENNDWWKPNKLKESQKSFLKENDVDKLDVHNDFGSYKVMLNTNDYSKSLIHSHNDLAPNYRVKMLKKILGDFNPHKIYDVGCGLGFATNEISKEYPRAEVIGMDISDDAITFGKKNFPNCKFLSEAIDPENEKQIFQADLIFATEFYPFTRTSNLNDHKQYLAHLTDGLSEEGKLVIIQLWDDSESLSINYNELKSFFLNLKFDLYSLPLRQIGKFVRSRQLANILSAIARPILRGITSGQLAKTKALVISKKQSHQ